MDYAIATTNNDEFLKYLFKSVKEDPAFDRGWVEIAKFYFAKKDNLKVTFYINKAIDIDEQKSQILHFIQK